MKKVCIITLFSFLSITAFGQVIPKGTRFIGGNFGFNLTQLKNNGTVESNTVNLGLTPSLTKFIKDNFAVNYSLGYNLGIGRHRQYATSEFHTLYSHAVAAGISFTNYKMLSEKLGVSVNYGGSLVYQFHVHSEGLSGTPGNINLYLSAGPGIIYLLNEKFAIEGSTSLVSLNAGYTWSEKTKLVNVGMGANGSPGLGLGFRYFLR
ncbi:hypothetical protein [Emticicia fluvialis]|uniref:hypothetical protein n=1 Tax=Emticicia fluvialis TaxID=2974474 RepID=UPI00216525FC|nr:hypothetical protein [Emticicia fluvialis]